MVGEAKLRELREEEAEGLTTEVKRAANVH
jgi:hypothetical protein